MSGLLYKDFISIKGKKLTVSYLVIFAAIIILRILMYSAFRLIKGSDMEIADMMADGFYWIFGVVFLTITATVICRCPSKLIEDDKTRGRVIDYYSSFPIKKSQYIASHYVFIGIMTYVVFSLTIIWYVIGSTLSSNEKFQPLWTVTMPLIFSIIYFVILCVAIDLGSFISLGISKGNIIRVAMIMIFCTVLLWFFFFGDIERMKNINLLTITEWMKAHQFGLSLIEIMGPFVVLAIYYMSYRISCHFCDKGAY